jgi:hypothetical protein
VQAVFVGFVSAARAAADAGHDHALEAWQFEWAAVRRFPHDGRWQTLRPDAYGRYRVGRQVLAFFLEIDRGTSGLRALESKFAGYCAYRDSGLYARDPAHGALAFPVILVVTTGEERLRHILESVRAVAAEHLTRPLAVWVATAADLAAHGPLGRIWRETARHPARTLCRDADAGVSGAEPLVRCAHPEHVPGRAHHGAAQPAGDRNSMCHGEREPPYLDL